MMGTENIACFPRIFFDAQISVPYSVRKRLYNLFSFYLLDASIGQRVKCPSNTQGLESCEHIDHCLLVST